MSVDAEVLLVLDMSDSCMFKLAYLYLDISTVVSLTCLEKLVLSRLVSGTLDIVYVGRDDAEYILS